MPEWRDLLLAEGGTDRDRKVAGGIQHEAAALVTGLQAASTGGLYSSDTTKLKLTGPGCDVNSLIRRGTKTRAGQWLCFANKSGSQKIRNGPESSCDTSVHRWLRY